MAFIVALYLESSPYIQWPVGVAGWLGLVGYLMGLVFLLWKTRKYGKPW